MAVQRGQPSVEFLQNWWKTLICVQTLVSQAWSGVLQKFKNLEPSEWSALAMEQAPRTVAPLEGKLQPVRVGERHSIFNNFAQLTISLAWNGIFWKFKNLKSLVWSTSEFWEWPGSIIPKEGKTRVPRFARGVTYSEYLSWHVANTWIH